MNLETAFTMLRHIAPWNILPEAAFVELKQTTKLIAIPKHQVVYHQEESGQGVFFVVEGLVKMSKAIPNGKDTVIFLAQPGDTIGEQLMGQEGCYSCRAQTLAESALLEIKADWIMRAAHQFPAFGWAWCRYFLGRLHETEERLLRYRFNLTRQRIALFLKQVARHQGRLLVNGEVELRLPLTHELIGEMVGVSRQQVTVIFNQWAVEGIIRYSQRRILLSKPERL